MWGWIWWNTFRPLNSTNLWLFRFYHHSHRWLSILWAWNLTLVIDLFNISCTSFYWSWFGFCNLTILMQLINSSCNICCWRFSKMLIRVVTRIIEDIWYRLNRLSRGFCVWSLSILLIWIWFYFRVLIIWLWMVLSSIWGISTSTVINCTVRFKILVFAWLLMALLILVNSTNTVEDWDLVTYTRLSLRFEL